MNAFFNKILLTIYLNIHLFFIRIGILLNRSEEQVFGEKANINQKYNYVQRKQYKNKFIEMLVSEVRNDILIENYYEVLKRADKFIKTATPRKMAVAADKYGTNYGMKDQYGRRYEHYGFFDDKHKHAGKTLGEVLTLEMDERRSKDDNYELLYIFNNTPIEVGIAKVMNVLEEKSGNSYEVVDIFKRSKQFEFPLKVLRPEGFEPVNKIEELTEFLHVKRIGFEHVQLEFFIPAKFKTEEIENNSEIFMEITNINTIFAKNNYGDTIWFGITKFNKRIKYNDEYEVWKFEGIEMQKMGQY